jgi:hypothetical protein
MTLSLANTGHIKWLGFTVFTLGSSKNDVTVTFIYCRYLLRYASKYNILSDNIFGMILFGLKN